jgi:hypothetical protein
MAQEDSESRNRVRRAQDKLIKEFLGHPDVTLIDAGYPPGR